MQPKLLILPPKTNFNFTVGDDSLDPDYFMKVLATYTWHLIMIFGVIYLETLDATTYFLLTAIYFTVSLLALIKIEIFRDKQLMIFYVHEDSEGEIPTTSFYPKPPAEKINIKLEIIVTPQPCKYYPKNDLELFETLKKDKGFLNLWKETSSDSFFTQYLVIPYSVRDSVYSRL